MKLIVCLLAVGIAFAACSGRMCGCVPPQLTAVVTGRVTMDTGGPAPLAAMFAQTIGKGNGNACVQGSLSSWGHADSLGRFELTVFGGGVGDSGCVFVGALYPPTQSGKDTVVGPFWLKFANPSVDTANVDIVIRH